MADIYAHLEAVAAEAVRKQDAELFWEEVQKARKAESISSLDAIFSYLEVLNEVRLARQAASVDSPKCES